jgi:AraC-like DNA-binding protein
MGEPAPITIAGRLASPIVAALRAEGHDATAFLAKIGLEESAIRDLHGRLTMEAFVDLHAASVATTSDPAFPLRAVQHLDRQAFPLGFYLLGSQPTIRDAYEFIRPYVATIVDRLAFTVVDDGPTLHVDFEIDGAPLAPPEFAEYYVAFALSFGRMLIASAEPATEVVFAHRWPRHGDAPDALFGAPVRFGGDAVRLTFPRPRIDIAIEGSDPGLGQLLAQSAEGWLHENPTSARVRDRVRRFLSTRLMDRGAPTTSDLRDAFRMSERTLRRRLEAEGTTVRELLDDARREVALTLLERGRSTLDEIAFRLGFSGANAFRRAFKRWTGKAPTEYKSTADRRDDGAS